MYNSVPKTGAYDVEQQHRCLGAHMAHADVVAAAEKRNNMAHICSMNAMRPQVVRYVFSRLIDPSPIQSGVFG